MFHDFHPWPGTHYQIQSCSGRDLENKIIDLSSPNIFPKFWSTLHIFLRKPSGIRCLHLCPVLKPCQYPYKLSQDHGEICPVSSSVRDLRCSAGCQGGAESETRIIHINLQPSVFIGDSEIVLRMIAKNDPADLPIFYGTRIMEIAALSDTDN